MIPAKLVEAIFRRSWALLIPMLIVPLLLVGLTRDPAAYRSRATVWATSPVGDSKPAIGDASPYRTPAQNHAQALNDLLATETFRAAIITQAGVVEPDASDRTIRAAAARLVISAGAAGVNLVTITADANAADTAEAIVSAVIDQYLLRGTNEILRDSAASETFYADQLGVARASLDQKRADLAEYLRANPRAADPTNTASLDFNYRTLVDQVQAQSRVVDSLVASLEATQLREAAAPRTQEASFLVQDPASLPEAALPVSATTRYGLPMAGVLLGLLIGAGYIVVAYRTDHTIRTDEDLVGLGIPLLGAIPQLEPVRPWLRWTPVGLYVALRERDFARKTATSLSTPSVTPNH